MGLSYKSCKDGQEDLSVTCQRCKVPMKELKGHIYHKKRKWKCPQCNRIRMQEPKPVRN